MAAITLEQVHKRYRGASEDAVDGLDLRIGDGEFMVLVGPSGCGKSTALRILAGLEEATAGTVRIGDRVVNDLEPKDRDIAMVFQNYALYPHMTVAQNLAFGLRLRKVSSAERDRRVAETARLLGLEHLLDRRPRALSGGQRQRVAMGRALVREPQAFLMDEPLSNLDAKLRVDMRAALKQLHDRLGVTTVYVTHDQVEAMTLGQRVAVLRHGRLQQVGAPQELYDAPANIFVAGFLGSPAMNFARAELVRDDRPSVRFGPVTLSLPAGMLDAGLGAYLGKPVVVGVRPHDVRLVPADAAADPHAAEPHAGGLTRVTVDVVESLGSALNVLFRLPGCRGVDSGAYDSTADSSGAGLPLDDDSVLWSATCDPRLGARGGDQLGVDLSVECLHFFDPGTGAAIRSATVTPAAPASAATTATASTTATTPSVSR